MNSTRLSPTVMSKDNCWISRSRRTSRFLIFAGFSFKGVSTYLEGFLARFSTPVLSKLKIQFFNQLTFIVPRLLQVAETSEILSSSTVWLVFGVGSVTLRRHYRGIWTSSPSAWKFFADTLTGRYHLQRRFSIHFSQYSLSWRNSRSAT